VIEWQTRGRYRLAPLALAFAAATFLGGVTAVVAGASHMMGALIDVTDMALYRSALTSGLYEMLGSLGTGAVLTIFQLFLWAAARRRTA